MLLFTLLSLSFFFVTRYLVGAVPRRHGGGCGITLTTQPVFFYRLCNTKERYGRAVQNHGVLLLGLSPRQRGGCRAAPRFWCSPAPEWGPGSLLVSCRAAAQRVFCWHCHWGQFLNRCSRVWMLYGTTRISRVDKREHRKPRD